MTIPSVRESLVLKASSGVITICVTVMIVAVVAAFTIVSVTGGDATELRSMLNIFMNAASVLLSGGALVYANAGARRSDDAAKGINGELHKTVAESVKSAVTDSIKESNGV